jgi:tRNA pseudouridine13 synthase
MQINQDYRALQLFTFQSWLWNEGVRRLLQLMFPREHLFPLPYQAGTLLFHREGAAEALQRLRSISFPLLSPETAFDDEQIGEAAMWALGKEKLKLSDLRIQGAERLMWFKHELRPVVVHPHKLVLGKPTPDELNRPYFKLNVAFTLPPGSYATLVVKRLFHFSPSDDRHLPAGAEVVNAESSQEKTRRPPPRGRFPRPSRPRPPRFETGPRRSHSGIVPTVSLDEDKKPYKKPYKKQDYRKHAPRKTRRK